MFSVSCDSEKLSCEGRPTATARLLETVETPLASAAVTRTGVGTVPEFTRTLTWPSSSVVRVTALWPPWIVRPPVKVVSDSVTDWLGSGLSERSLTWKTTVDEVVRPEPWR